MGTSLASAVGPAGARFVAVLLAASLMLMPFGTVTRAAPGDVSGVDVQLPARPPGVDVRIAVTRATDGTAVPGAEIRMWIHADDQRTWLGQTDEDGRVRFGAVPPGQYLLRIAGPGSLQDGWYRAGVPGRFTGDSALATRLSVADADVRGIVIALPRGGDVQGRIRTAQVGGATDLVRAYPARDLGPGARPAAEAQTGPTGAFRLRGLAPGAYVLAIDPTWDRTRQGGCYRGGDPDGFTADCAQATVVEVGLAGVSGINVSLPLAPDLVGRLEDAAGRPVCGVVSARRLGAPLGRPERDPDRDTVRACGSFRIRWLDAGRYRLSVLGQAWANIQPGWYAADAPGRWAARAADATELVVKRTTDLGTIVPQAGGLIRGTLSSVVPSSDLLRAIAIPLDPTRTRSWRSSVAGPSGFVIKGLGPGRYRLALVATERGSLTGCAWYDQDATGGTTWDLAAATVIPVAGTTVTGVRATLPRGATMRGRITGPGGTPVQGGMVEMLPSRELALLIDACTGWHPAGEISASGVTGRWAVHALPAGRYRVFVAPWSSLQAGWYRAGVPGGWTADRSTATWVTVG